MHKTTLTFGIVLALVGAYIMFDGDLFGDRNLSTAITIGIVGIALIATSVVKKKKK
ncbi:hypothetical protein H8D36_01965 [archaeon]|nr:hypothetical protein [archaeon]MBL7057669.1 hypothetical protein [Candidatus Woesearchaeota archaeon]